MNFLTKISNWIKQKTWRILLSALSFVIFLTVLLRYGFGTLEWKDAIQTSAQVAVVLGLAFAWRQIQVTSEQVQSAQKQLEATKDLHRIQFEDSLAKEYRDLIQNISVKALLGKDLSPEEYENAKPGLFHYINLSNDQIFLYQKRRISEETWKDWKSGIEANLKLPAVKQMWQEIDEAEKNEDESGKSFQELRGIMGKIRKLEAKILTKFK